MFALFRNNFFLFIVNFIDMSSFRRYNNLIVKGILEICYMCLEFGWKVLSNYLAM